MATTKYFVLPSSTGANFTDFNLSYGSVTLNGEQVAFVGSSAVDAVFVRPGITVDFTLSGSGADKIYLGGNFASYTASIAGSVMTLQRGAGSTLESVSFIKSTSAASSDSVIFADGALNSLDLYNNLKTGTALPALSTAETSVAPLAPAAPGSVLNASIKAFALNSTGDTFAPAHPGVAMTVVGSLGVDTVYVPRGGVVDCTLLGSGQDIIYFTGNWADYNKVISGSVVTFSRTADGYTESVKVVGSATNISLNDRLVFADGAVYSGNAKTTLTASLTAAFSTVTGYDATMTTPSVVVTPGMGPTVASVAISSATGVQSSLLNAGDVVSVTVTMSEATTVTGTPSLALAIGGDTVQATYASGSGTTALVFNYMILAGQTDANGISVAVNSLALNGGTLINAGNAATLAHAAVTDNAGYQVDATAPTLALTSYSVAENATAVATLAATDANALIYSLTGAGADNGLFNLTSGGILSFASAPNFEGPGSAAGSNAYSITVNITDAAGNVTNQAVTVNVTNLNDNAPVFTSGATGTVAENAATSTVIYTAATTDADNLAARTYTVSGTDAGLLDITSAGVVTLKASADYESKTSYSFNLIANDGTNNMTQAVVVSVTNVNEAPVMTSSSATSFAENGAGTVYTATATDVDAGTTPRYSLSGTDAGLFNINATTGAVTFKVAPNYEAPADAGANNVYNISVTANDGVNTSSAQAVAIAVTNVNEAPAITSSLLTTSLFEVADAAAGTATAYTLLPGQTAQGYLSGTGDHDWYTVYLAADVQYSFAMTGSGASDVKNPYLRLYSSTNQSVASDDNSLQGSNAVFTYTPATNGYYYIDAGASTTSAVGEYSIIFSAGPKPSFGANMGAGVIDKDYSWSSHGTSAVVTYGFRQTLPSDYLVSGHDLSTFSQLTSAEQIAVRSNLQFWSEICDITFTEVNAGGYTDDATILIGNYSDVTDGAAGFCIASLTSNVAPSSNEGDVWLNVGNGVSKTTLGLGSNSANTILHELGHSIGLNHPGQYNAEPGKTITYAANSQFLQDSDQYSVMSYFKGTSTQAFSQNPSTPMMFDILAAQNIYGVNSATRATDTVYGFNSNAGTAYLFSGSSASTAFCVWDGNGTDTIDVSGFAQNQLINLCPGTFSDVGGLKSNVSIAIGCSIENAKGGSGSDVIFGNELNNIITGGIGNDMLFGGAGNDTAIFSGTRLNYVVSSIIDGWLVVGADGTDRLFNIEYAKFSDQTITLTSNSSYVITSYVEADFAENQTGIIYTATATDVDAATTLIYSVGGTDGSKFSINANTGAVTFINAPDHEAPTDSSGDNLYNLTVYVSDGANISGAQQIAITVTDVNEAPVITSVATASFAENGTGTAYSATATDPDMATTLTYTLGGTDLGRFNINFNTGAVTFKVAPDYEAPTDAGSNNVYDITVSASDGSLISTSKSVAITVTNVNEAPVITSVATASFAENGTATAYTATATDPEAGTTFIYALGGTDAGRFNINSSTGAVTFKVAPNYEAPIDAGTNNVYNITVSASDGSLISTSKAVAITVTNVNEAPVITSVATASISENGTGAVYAVTATDVDAGATRTYAISGADRLVFNINSTTGTVTFKVAPDYEAPTDADANNVYDITVTANDGVNTSAALTVAVSVTNLNDNAPAFTSGGTGTVAENAATNTAIYVAATTDADNLAARTYAVSGTDAGLLDITSAGVVTLKTSADYEAKTSYSFNVIANDGANTVTKAVVVSVTNLNDNTPTMPSAETLSFSENGSDTVFTAYGTDADAGTTLMYSLGGTDSARFNINTTTGAVTFKVAPDYEAPIDADANNVYNITVTANDGVNTSAAQAVAVNVTNLNDNAPVFTSGGTGMVAENAATNTVIYAAATTDADNRACAYTLSGTDSTLVDITSAGVVTLKFSADYETKASYSFNVIANDGSYTVTQAVVVSITNLNDANFTENGTGVAYTAAITNMNTAGPLTYALGGTDATRFNINATTGAVTFKVAPNYETPTDSDLNNIYDITFTASDGAKTSAAQPVQIVVTDVLELGQPLIDLGAYGKLIAPVQVDGGKWFYYWDRSGDGSSADTGKLNGGVDYTSHDFLDGIFNTNINGVINNSVANADGLYGTTDIYRYATINGVHLALPTAGGVTSAPFGANGIGQYQPGTSVGSATAANGSNAANATYDDLLAVWDAYNGTGNGGQINGTPVGWVSSTYWSASPTFSGHAYVNNLGRVINEVDQISFRVALQVLPV